MVDIHADKSGSIAHTRRSTLLALGLLGTLIALALHLVIAAHVEFCGWRDGCFYFLLAKEIANKHDFLVPFVWNYQVNDPSLPSQALNYWRAGASFILAIPALFDRITLVSSAVLASLAAILLSLSSAQLAWRVTRDPVLTLLAYLICLSLPPLWTMPLTPDAGLFYAVAVASFLALVSVERQSLAIEVLGVILVGVAYFIRNDAIILGAPLIIILGKRLYDARGTVLFRVEGRRAALLCVTFVLSLLPTCLLSYSVTGHFLNSDIDRVVYFTRNAEFTQYGMPVTFATLKAYGLLPLLKLRLATLGDTLHALFDLCGQLVTLLAMVGVVFAATQRHRAYAWRLIGPGVFLLVLVGIYVMVMPALAVNAVTRSYAAFLPCFAVLAAIAIGEVAMSRRALIAIAGATIAFSMVHGLSETKGLLDQFDGRRQQYLREAQLMDGDRPERQPIVAMVADPAPFTVTTGIPSVALPSNGIAAAESAIRRYHVTDVVADRWRNGKTLASALHTQAIEVPNSTQLVIRVPDTALAAR